MGKGHRLDGLVLPSYLRLDGFYKRSTLKGGGGGRNQRNNAEYVSFDHSRKYQRMSEIKWHLAALLAQIQQEQDDRNRNSKKYSIQI